MDLTALSAYSSLAAAIGQLVSAVAVAVSIIYLALQLRQNTRAVQAGTYLGAMSNTISVTSPIYMQPEFAALVLEAVNDPSSLSRSQALRWNTYMRTMFRQFDSLYHQSQGGALEADVWPGYERIMVFWLQHPGCSRWFEENSHFFSATLQDLYSEKIRPQIVREPSETQPGGGKA